LGDGSDAVHMVSPILADAMEVETGSIVGQAVDKVNLDSISPISLDSRTWETAINGESVAGDTVGGDCDVLQLEPVFHDDTCVWNFIVVIGVCVVIAPDASIARCVARTGRGGTGDQVGRSLSSECRSLGQGTGENSKPRYKSVGSHRGVESNKMLRREGNC
jgi:hypothetical protein